MTRARMNSQVQGTFTGVSLIGDGIGSTMMRVCEEMEYAKYE